MLVLRIKWFRQRQPGFDGASLFLKTYNARISLTGHEPIGAVLSIACWFLQACRKTTDMSQQASNVSTESPAKSSRNALSVSQLEKVCYRLGTSLKAGIPVAQSWGNETQLLRGRMRRAFERVQIQLKDGGSLADALSAERHFPRLLTEIVRVGEETGRLDQAFLRMADHYRAIVRMKRTFLQGVTWPALQLTAAAAIVSVFFVVLHVLETRISGLVAPDMFMLGLSPLENLMLFWAVLLGTGLGLFLIVKGVTSGWFGALPLRMAMTIPLVGNTIKELALSRFAWAFGTAVDSGMYATQAMQLGLRSTQNRYYQSHERRSPRLWRPVRIFSQPCTGLTPFLPICCRPFVPGNSRAN